MRWTFGACCLALLGSVSLAAETPESLVQKLGSPRFAEREAAGEELLKLGLAALPVVKAAAETSPDAEIRERAAALLEPLLRADETTRLLAVKKVRLDYKAAPMASVVSDFKQKTGIPLHVVTLKVADANRPVTLSGEYEPWEGLEALLQAAGLKEEHRTELPIGSESGEKQASRLYRSRYSDDTGGQPMIFTSATAPVLLVDGKSENLPAMRTGGVRVTALPANFSANRVVRGAGRVIFHLEAAPVPSTGWHNATGIRIFSAEDDDGRPVFADLKLTHDPLAGMYGYGWNGGWGGWGGGRRAVFWGGGGMMLFEDGNGGGGASPNSNPRLVPVAIRTNDRAVKTLRKFEGSILGEVHTPNSPVITIEKVENAIGVPHQGPTQSNFTVLEAKTQKDGSTLLKLRHESLTAWAIQQMKGGGGIWNNNDNPNDVISKIKYYDAEGKALKVPANEQNNYNGDGYRQTVEFTVRFPKGSKPPVKIVVTGTKVTSVEVPFSLANVSVP